MNYPELKAKIKYEKIEINECDWLNPQWYPHPKYVKSIYKVYVDGVFRAIVYSEPSGKYRWSISNNPNQPYGFPLWVSETLKNVKHSIWWHVYRTEQG